MKKLAILLLSLLSLSLVGCDYETEKNTLQASFDRANPKGNNAICISSGGSPQSNVSLMKPYETYDIDPEVNDYNYLIKGNNRRNERFAIFAEIGLLNQEKLPNGQYRYTPTDEGRHYISERSNDRFCFGRVLITDIKYEKKQDGLSLFTYRYYLENVPDWARDKRLYRINPNMKDPIKRTPDNETIGGMVGFTSDKKLASGSDTGAWIY